jgi:hypothetical protein
VTIEYNILTSARRVANTVVIIVEDFCYVHCFVQESNSLSDRQVISYSYICCDIYRQNKFVFDTRECSFAVSYADVRSDHVSRNGNMNKRVSGISKGHQIR